MEEIKLYRIYKLVNSINDKLYVGSTQLLLKDRFQKHKSKSLKNESSIKEKELNIIGWHNVQIIELENKLTTKFNARILEQQYIDLLNPVLNSIDSILNKENDKENRKEFQKKYYKENKIELLEKFKKHYKENNIKIKNHKKEYRNNLINCDCLCGGTYTIYSKHTKTKEHIEFTKESNEVYFG